MDAYEREALRARDLARLRERVAGAERCAELAVHRPRDKVRVSVDLDAGRHAEPDRLTAAARRGKPREPLDVVRAVDDEAAYTRAKRPHDLVVGLRVPMQLDPRRRESRAARSLELAQGGDAGVDAFSRDDRADADERARLDRVRDAHRPVTEERIDVLAEAGADGAGVVDVERSPVAVGERAHVVCPDAHVAVVPDGGPERPDRALDHEVRSSAEARRATTR